MKRFAFSILPAALLLAACEDSAEPAPKATGDGGTLNGDVLGGSISDDMIPLEELRSQSPPTRQAASAAEEEAGDDE